jgi:hypothetical protein
LAFDLDRYRERAERFSELVSREYYLHLAGHKSELEIEPIYDAYADLFTADAARRLRELAGRGSGDDERRLRYLLQFSFEGLIGLETRMETAQLAALEASIEVDPGDGPVPYRAVRIEQANESRPSRRQALEEAQDEALIERLNPLYHATLDRSHELCRAMGWPSYAVAFAELRGIDLETLARQAASFLEATEERYATVVDPELRRQGAPALGELRRSDLPRFFRATRLDRQFPADRLMPSFSGGMEGLGIDLARQANIHVDGESRPTKSPRAFCSTPRVPDEIHLVIAPTGGYDDYRAFFHEGGHAEHYAGTDPELPFEFRHLGDSTVTESFAFLLEHLVEDRDWLATQFGSDDPQAAAEHSRAAKLVMLRRYAAKLHYELELHGPSPALEEMPGRYAELLSQAVRVAWPRAGWLADVDGGFYAACYLRAWVLETRWRAALRERFGAEWFASREAGKWLRSLWREGQRLDGDELLAEALGEELDFAAIAGEFAPGAGAAT